MEPPLQIDLEPLVKAPNGPAKGLISGGLADTPEQHPSVGDLQQALNEAKKSEAQLRKIIDTIPTVAWCNVPDGSNEFVNKRWHEYTGLSEQEARGRGWTAAIHPEDLPGFMEKWEGHRDRHKPDECEIRLWRSDGAFRWFLFRRERLRDETGVVVGWYGTAADIGDRKRAEPLRVAEERALEMIADGASLKDVLDHLCSSIDAQVSPSVTTALLMDPDGKRLWRTAGPRTPGQWISAISPVPVAKEAGFCGTAAFLKARVIVTDSRQQQRVDAGRLLSEPLEYGGPHSSVFAFKRAGRLRSQGVKELHIPRPE